MGPHYIPHEVARPRFLTPPLVPSGLGAGRPAGRLGDVRQEAARHAAAGAADGGGGPAARLPQPLPARQGDGRGRRHLHGADQDHLPGRKPTPAAHARRDLKGREVRRKVGRGGSEEKLRDLRRGTCSCHQRQERGTPSSPESHAQEPEETNAQGH